MLKSLLVSCLALEVATAQRWTRTQRPVPTPTPTPTPTPSPVVTSPNAVQTLYGQCGGQTWTGPTRCPAGSYCKNDGNIWYSQCVAIESAGGSASATIRTLTTVFSVGPTVVSTLITYLSPKPTTTTPSVVTITLTPDEPCNHEYLC
ncbi:hypothetical protein C8A05DRAFT_13957 [Staphylotrichum tortipilum]|uniref:CBM1 domain-containing protein n=1 Tax=Staphylotrichum tortipilum TaxID=2831512 RepID=A0AAN6MPP3_9PEZI|nr:hypothetical protein C8A05DRAFT_13957 [Staphylotrichum longicolle]